MIGIIGKKLGMTQIFNEQGQQIPVTVIEAEPNPVLGRDGQGEGRPRVGAARLRRAAPASRVEEGRGDAEAASRATRGRRAREEGRPRRAAAHSAQRSASTSRAMRRPRSRRTTSATSSRSTSSPSAIQVKVTGTSKGRGFQGVVKRYGIGGGPNTHGNTKHRRPGSIGPGTDPSRVIKGKKMPGHYGDGASHADAPPRREDRRRAQPDLHPRLGCRSDQRHRRRAQAGLTHG